MEWIKKHKIISGVIGFIILISLIGLGNGGDKTSNTVAQQNTISSSPTSSIEVTTKPQPTYLTTKQVIQGLDLFFKLEKIGDVGGGIAWDGINKDTGSRVRIITDSKIQDKVTKIYVWAKMKGTDETTNKVSFFILKQIATNTVPESIDWLSTSYAKVIKDPGSSEEKVFGDKLINVGYADITSQLTFLEEVNY
jgi:hypothetical protein